MALPPATRLRSSLRVTVAPLGSCGVSLLLLCWLQPSATTLLSRELQAHQSSSDPVAATQSNAILLEIMIAPNL